MTKTNLVTSSGGSGGTGGSESTGGVGDQTYVCSSTEIVGDPVYHTATAGTVAKADAAVESTMPAFGFIATKPTPTSCTVRTSGPLDEFSGLVPGTSYYLAVGGGTVPQASVPTTSGTGVQLLGEATTATKLNIEIDGTYILNT